MKTRDEIAWCVYVLMYHSHFYVSLAMFIFVWMFIIDVLFVPAVNWEESCGKLRTANRTLANTILVNNYHYSN